MLTCFDDMDCDPIYKYVILFPKYWVSLLTWCYPSVSIQDLKSVTGFAGRNINLNEINILHNYHVRKQL